MTTYVAFCLHMSPPCLLRWYRPCRRGPERRDNLWSRDQSHTTLWWALPHHTSEPFKNLWPYVFWRKKYFIFSLSIELIWPGDQGNMWLHGWIYLVISHQLAMFYGHRPCQRGYVTLFVCHVTTYHYVVRGS